MRGRTRGEKCREQERERETTREGRKEQTGSTERASLTDAQDEGSLITYL